MHELTATRNYDDRATHHVMKIFSRSLALRMVQRSRVYYCGRRERPGIEATTCIVGRMLYFSGLGNLELKMVAMSYEMSLCFESTQPEPATDVRRRDRAHAAQNRAVRAHA